MAYGVAIACDLLQFALGPFGWGFADEMLEGFVAAHANLVRRVPGGVVRSNPAPAGKVAVVVVSPG